MLSQLTNAKFLNAFKRNQPVCPSTSAKKNYTTPTENSVPGLESITTCTLQWRDKVEFNPTLFQASQNQENSLVTLHNPTIAGVCTDRHMKLVPKAQKCRNCITFAYVCSSLKCCCNVSIGVALNVWFTTNGSASPINMWREQVIIEWS